MQMSHKIEVTSRAHAHRRDSTCRQHQAGKRAQKAFPIVDMKCAFGVDSGNRRARNIPRRPACARFDARSTAISAANIEKCTWTPPCSAPSVTTGRFPKSNRCSRMPFVDLLFHAQRVHRAHHEPSTVQMSTLLSIKTGACPEDCAYCPQSVRYDTGLERETLLEVAEVRECRAARQGGGRHSLLHGRRVPLARSRSSSR